MYITGCSRVSKRKMIELLSTIIVAEAALVVALFFKTPIQKPLLTALDSINRGWPLLMLTTLAGITFAVFTSSLYTILKIHHRSIHSGSVNITDQLFLAVNLLQASLTGISLFLSVVINKLHQLIREKDSLETIIKAEEKQFKEKKIHITSQLNALDYVAAELKSKLKKLEFEQQMKTNKAEAAAAVLLALKKQSEGVHLEYDCLLDYNQTLRHQLQSIDERLVKDSQTSRWTNLKSNIMPWGIQTTNKNRGTEVGYERSENEVLLSNQCHQPFFTGNNPTSWPRHRRPIYQH